MKTMEALLGIINEICHRSIYISVVGTPEQNRLEQ